MLDISGPGPWAWAQGLLQTRPPGAQGPIPWYRAAIEFPVNHLPMPWKFTREPLQKCKKSGCYAIGGKMDHNKRRRPTTKSVNKKNKFRAYPKNVDASYSAHIASWCNLGVLARSVQLHRKHTEVRKNACYVHFCPNFCRVTHRMARLPRRTTEMGPWARGPRLGGPGPQGPMSHWAKKYWSRSGVAPRCMSSRFRKSCLL